MNVNVFRTKGVIEDNTVFTSSTGDGPPHEGLAVCKAKAVPSFLGVFVRFRKSNPRPPAEALYRFMPWKSYTNPQQFSTYFCSSQTFHEIISFLYSFVTKMQEGDYDAELPKEETKVCQRQFVFFAIVFCLFLCLF